MIWNGLSVALECFQNPKMPDITCVHVKIIAMFYIFAYTFAICRRISTIVLSKHLCPASLLGRAYNRTTSRQRSQLQKPPATLRRVVLSCPWHPYNCNESEKLAKHDKEVEVETSPSKEDSIYVIFRRRIIHRTLWKLQPTLSGGNFATCLGGKPSDIILDHTMAHGEPVCIPGWFRKLQHDSGFKIWCL